MLTSTDSSAIEVNKVAIDDGCRAEGMASDVECCRPFKAATLDEMSLRWRGVTDNGHHFVRSASTFQFCSERGNKRENKESTTSMTTRSTNLLNLYGRPYSLYRCSIAQPRRQAQARKHCLANAQVTLQNHLNNNSKE